MKPPRQASLYTNSEAAKTRSITRSRSTTPDIAFVLSTSAFLTVADAQYGVTTNDDADRRTGDAPSGQGYGLCEPAWVPLAPAKDFAGAYLYADAIYKALDKLVNKSVLLHGQNSPR
jgi:hypothetical protein